MPFAVHTRTQPGVTGRDATVYVLDDGAGGRAEVWPALGFNCFHWEAVRGGRTLDLLYADPALFGDGRPTRSGIPILFPFPNRIRDGRFTWDGKEYQLPLNDPVRQERHPRLRRAAGRGASSIKGPTPSSAWVTGEFQPAVDAPDCLPLWPADYHHPHYPPSRGRRAAPSRRRWTTRITETAALWPRLSSLFPARRSRRGRRRPTAPFRAPATASGRWPNRCRPAKPRRSMPARDLNSRAASATCNWTTC